MIINNRKDLDAAPEDVRSEYMEKLAASINKYQWDGSDWVLYQDTLTVARFEFDVSDFPNAPVPNKPTHNPDADQKRADDLERLGQLKAQLRDTDYVALADYDKDKPEVILQRAEWRAEVRELEAALGIEE